MLFQKGQKAKLGDLGISDRLSVKLNVNASFEVDISCFGLNGENKLEDDRYMVFYNQKNSPNNEVSLTQSGGLSTFELNLGSLPANVQKLSFTATAETEIKNMASLEFSIKEHVFNVTGSDFSGEKAIIVAEIYKKDGVWRVGAVGQGFNGGIQALLNYFGGVSAEELSQDVPKQMVNPVEQKVNGLFNEVKKVDLKKKVFLEKRVNLEKTLAQEAPKLLDLSKKAAVSLEKRGLGEHKAKVALCLDISASMSRLYSSGLIQEFAERILALGCRLDDDGSIDIFLFGEKGYRPAPLTVQEFKGYISRMSKEYPLEYDTRYSEAIELVRKFYSPNYKYERSEPLGLDVPVYVMFVTDGQPSDKMASTKALKNASFEPIFWQFMGLSSGGADFSYLERLDDLTGRYIDNADFFSVTNLNSVSDDALYDKLMNEYPKWLEEAKRKRLIVD